jgi:hypothetical protein
MRLCPVALLDGVFHLLVQLVDAGSFLSGNMFPSLPPPRLGRKQDGERQKLRLDLSIRSTATLRAIYSDALAYQAISQNSSRDERFSKTIASEDAG